MKDCISVREVRLAWLKRDTPELWRMNAGREIPSQNNASAANSYQALTG